MPSRRVHRPDPPPLETDDVKVVTLLTAGWVLALLVLAVLRLVGVEVQDWWFAMCGYGTALGLFGIRYCKHRHDAIERDKKLGLPQRS